MAHHGNGKSGPDVCAEIRVYTTLCDDCGGSACEPLTKKCREQGEGVGTHKHTRPPFPSPVREGERRDVKR